MRRILVLLIAILGSSMLYSQSSSAVTTSFNFKKSVNYSVQLGFLMGGYDNGFKDALNNQNFDDTPECFLFCPPPKHPHSKANLHFAFDVDYNFHPNQSIGATFGTLQNFGYGMISGYNSDYGSLDFEYNEYSLTPHYRFFEPSGVFLFEGGISGNIVNYQRIDSEAHFDSKSNFQLFHPGIMLGVQFRFMNREKSFLRAGVQFSSLLGNVKLGSFKNEYLEPYFDEGTGTWRAEEVVKETFQEEKVSFNKFTVFVVYGIK